MTTTPKGCTTPASRRCASRPLYASDPPPALSDLPLRRGPPTAVNVHGHIHAAEAASQRHFNVSVERTDYAPVGLTWVIEQARDQETKDAAGKVNR